jgi:hypothetical protein
MKFVAGFVALWLVLNTLAVSQAIGTKPRVFITDTGRNPAVTAIARAISDHCPNVRVTSTITDADYFVTWRNKEGHFSQWGGYQNVLNVYRRNRGWVGATITYRYIDGATFVCRAIGRAEAPSPQPSSRDTRR